MIRYVATNLTDLHREPSFLSELLTQVTNGVALEVLKDQDEKWCYVRQTDGYEGWAYTPFLTETPPPRPTHLLRVHSTLWAHPIDDHDNRPPRPGQILTNLTIGTAVCIAESRNHWARVEPCGRMLPGGWTSTYFLRSLQDLPIAPHEARALMISKARELRGTYYLWGGCSGWGIDCSGLAQLVHRLCGYAIPRDCSLQYPVGRPALPEPPFQKGDLLYFWNESRTKVGHVGISLGEGWKIIHSSRKNNGVYEEDVQSNPKLKDFFAGARSFLPGEG